MAALVLGRHHLQARSREFLRRGLLLSGAIHLALLFAFLSLQGKGEVLVPTYDRVTEIFRQPIDVPPIPLVPPADVPSGPPATDGRIVPVDPRDFKIPFNPADFGKSIDRTGVIGESRSEGSDVSKENNLPPPPDPTHVFSEREVDVRPVAIYAPKPEYPSYPREIGLTGLVVTELLVLPDGSVSKVRIQSGNKLFTDNVQEALYRWKFRPAMMQGKPVAVWVEIPVNFTL